MKKELNNDHLGNIDNISPLGIIYILLITSIGLIYFYNQSIQIYGQQSYHIDTENYSNLFLDASLSSKPLEEEATAKNNTNNISVNMDSYYRLFSNTNLSGKLTEDLSNVKNSTDNLQTDIENSYNLFAYSRLFSKPVDHLPTMNPYTNKSQINKESYSDLYAYDSLLNKYKEKWSKAEEHSDNFLKSMESDYDLSFYYANLLSNPLENVLITNSRSDNIQSEPSQSERVNSPPTQTQRFDANQFKKIILNKSDKVFFIGDSLMQGIAPYVKKMLFKQYKIESINLSKQNTGLTYPNAFNWPETVEQTLTENPLIKLVVVFLGPNDPWSIRLKDDNRYAKFKSNLWEQSYRYRIQQILNSAKQHQAQVLWLAAPCMKKSKLNSDVVYLNSLYQSEMEKSYQHFLTTNEFLGCSYDKFNDFIETDNTKIKVRIDDGIHFTVAGQRILANAIMENIAIN